jgi:hypothetical protein
LLDSVTPPKQLPAWLIEQDVEFFVQEFTRSGFRGGLNWCRNIDRMWELAASLSGAKIRQSALFVAGELDAVNRLLLEFLRALKKTGDCTRLGGHLHFEEYRQRYAAPSAGSPLRASE